MAADPDTSDDEDVFGDDHVDSPGTFFGFLANQTPNTLHDDDSLLPGQYNDSTYMAPHDLLLADQLLTSSESKSAYRLQKSVKIAENAPILFSDTKNDNEAIINHNKLLSTVDIKVPQSIVLYCSNKDHEKLSKRMDINHDNNEDHILSESLWQKEFEMKSKLIKQNVLQNEDETYKNLKYEYDFHDKTNGIFNHNNHNIKVNPNNFENVCNELKQSNPHLFTTNENEMNINEIMQLMGYHETDESELLSINPQNITTNDDDLDLSRLLERNQCHFDKEIIIDDHPQSEHDDDDDDIIMQDMGDKNKVNKAYKEIEMNIVPHKPDAETFLISSYETKQKMKRINGDESPRKRKRDNDDLLLLSQSAKRHKKQHKHIRFKMKSNIREYKQSKDNKNKEEEDDDLDLLLIDDNNEEYDDDAIGDNLSDMMPESDDDWDGNTASKPFGIVEDKEEEIEEKKNEEKEEKEEELEAKHKRLPLSKHAVNNSSIWPNTNREYEECEWLDSVIISDCIPPKRAMNTCLIIDLNDARMQWTEEFIKNMTAHSEKAQCDTKDDTDTNDNDKEKSLSLERKFAAKKWNVSNDDEYSFRDISFAQRRNLHTPMAYNLDKETFPQILSIDGWVSLHREAIKLDCETVKAKSIKIRISSKIESKRSKERMDNITNKYSMYIPQNWRELSATTDRVVLLEYLEEHPLIIQSIGMTSSITTLLKGNNKIKVEDGTIRVLNPSEKSPLLGAPRNNKWVTVIENKLYIAPIRSHNVNNNLFLLIGSGHTYYIRKMCSIFAVGQIQPKQVVYHPGSRAFRSYMHDRSKVHIYRMLQKKDAVSVCDVLRSFPLDSEDAIKETLRTVASHDSRSSGGYWIRKSDFLSKRSELEIQQIVSPEQEVLRQMFMNCFCRLYHAGIAASLIGSNRGGSWKRVLKNLVFNKDLLDILHCMKKEMETQKAEWESETDITVLKDTNPSLKLRALHLIEELLFCTSWYLSDQFLRCYRGEGEMQLNGYGNPFKNGEGFNYLRDLDKTSSEAIKLMVASAGNRANTKADFRRMPIHKARQILKVRYLVPDVVLDKLDRRKIMELLQKKSREALSKGSQNKTALRYARISGSRKSFRRSEYNKKIQRLMKKHLMMLRCADSAKNDEQAIDDSSLMADLENLMQSIDDDDTIISKKKKKKKLIKKYKLRYTFSYNDQITGERKKEICEYDDINMIKKYKLCIKENDKKFLRLKEYSKLHQMRMEMMSDDDITVFMNDRQRERHQKMQKIKNMPPEEREMILVKLEGEKPYITCSSCKRKGHNSNNKYCSKYHENKEKKKDCEKDNDCDDDDAGIDSFIDRAIDKKHFSYRSHTNNNNKKNKKMRENKKGKSDKIDDPRLTFVCVLHHMLEKARDVNGSMTFKSDPTALNRYNVLIRSPMCLDWIHENILYTEQCIRAPYLSQTISIENYPSQVRGEGKPNKKKYKTFEAFKEDIALIHSNSVKYNGLNSSHTRLALTIVEEVDACHRQYKTAIVSLNKEVNATYMTFELQPILNQLINGILDAPTLDAFKSLDKYRKTEINRVLGLYEIRQKVHDKHYQTFANFVDDLKELQQFCYDLNKDEFETGLKILPTQFDNKLKQFKKQLKKIDPDSIHHFKLNKKPPFI